MNFQEFRAKYPDYDDLDDATLGAKLWNSSYKKDMNMWEFAEKVNIPLDTIPDMQNVALEIGASAKEIGGEKYYEDVIIPKRQREKEMGEKIAFTHGQTIGLGDDTQAMSLSIMEKLTNPERDFGDIYEKNFETTNQLLRQYQNSYPMEALGVETMGAISSPASWIRLPAYLQKLPTSLQAMTRGFFDGTLYGINDSEDKKLANGVELGVMSAFMTGGTEKFFRTMKPYSPTARALVKLRKNPTVENLRLAKNLAYKDVEKMGGLFGYEDTKAIFQAGDNAINGTNLQKGLPTATFDETQDLSSKFFRDMLKKEINSKTPKVRTLIELESLKKQMNARYKDAKSNDRIILMEMMKKIDDVMMTKPIEGEAIKLARNLNGKYMKTKILAEGFKKRERKTGFAGLGGNTYNRWKDVVVGILNDDNKLRYFDSFEKSQLEKFAKTKPTERMMRAMSKLSPFNGGLGTIIFGYGGFFQDPMGLGLGTAGVISQTMLDRGVRKDAGQLIDAIATGTEQIAPLTRGVSTPTATVTGSEAGLNNPLEGGIPYLKGLLSDQFAP